MKFDIGDNLQMLLGFVMVMLVIIFSIHEVRKCSADEDRFETGCILSGGDPYECCNKFRGRGHCSKEEK